MMEKNSFFLFNVIRNKRNEYEIFDESCQKIINLSTISFDKIETWNCFVKFLEHLIIFKYFEKIENRNSNAFFENSFAYYFNDANENKMKTTKFLNVKHEFTLNLTFQNLSDRTLYLIIFGLNSSWQIDFFACNFEKNEFMTMLSKNDKFEHNDKTKIKWNMNVSKFFKNMRQCQCENILKIFVISKASSFATMMLFKISKFVNALDKFMRNENYDQLSFFFSKLKTDFLRNAKNDSLNEKWIFRNFLIQITISVMSSI